MDNRLFAVGSMDEAEWELGVHGDSVFAELGLTTPSDWTKYVDAATKL